MELLDQDTACWGLASGMTVCRTVPCNWLPCHMSSPRLLTLLLPVLYCLTGAGARKISHQNTALPSTEFATCRVHSCQGSCLGYDGVQDGAVWLEGGAQLLLRDVLPDVADVQLAVIRQVVADPRRPHQAYGSGHHQH